MSIVAMDSSSLTTTLHHCTFLLRLPFFISSIQPNIDGNKFIIIKSMEYIEGERIFPQTQSTSSCYKPEILCVEFCELG